MTENRYSISKIASVITDLDRNFDAATVRKWRAAERRIVPVGGDYEPEGTTSTATYSLKFAVWLRVLLELNRWWGMDLSTAAEIAHTAASMGMKDARVVDHQGGGAAVDKGYQYLVVPDPKKPSGTRMAKASQLQAIEFMGGRSCALVIDVIAATNRVRRALAEAT